MLGLRAKVQTRGMGWYRKEVKTLEATVLSHAAETRKIAEEARLQEFAKTDIEHLHLQGVGDGVCSHKSLLRLSLPWSRGRPRLPGVFDHFPASGAGARSEGGHHRG